ncbi:MAG: uroporphyrinogen-III C-methyltransferase [Gammaproteobacteria bacterium]|nr:MAG: uroporphyrinogen-III C-methyltransferase [Gammaproteobacteria bacterium]
MSDEQIERKEQRPEAQPARVPARAPRLAVFLALLALAAAAANWAYTTTRATAGQASGEELAGKLQRRMGALEDRMRRERDDLDRLGQRVGTGTAAEDSLAGRIAQLEEAIAKLPGGERVRLTWRVEQAEYFMRVANAQQTLAGDSAGALAALTIADEHLRDAADPRLAPVRKLLADDIAALRAIPRVDTEGLVLKLTALAGTIPGLPLKRSAPAAFTPAPAATPDADLTGTQRLLASLRAALGSIVSIRRTGTPADTMLSEESADSLVRSLELELQMARLALLRGQAGVYLASLTNVRQALERNFDTGAVAVEAALTSIDELMRSAPPESLPDVSASLGALLRIKEHALTP